MAACSESSVFFCACHMLGHLVVVVMRSSERKLPRCRNEKIPAGSSRVSTTPGNLLEFKNPPGNPGNLLEFNWSSWKFLCKMSKIDRIGFQS